MSAEPTEQDREMVEKFFYDDDDEEEIEDVDDLVVEEEEEPEVPPFRETATPEEMYEASVKVLNSQNNHRLVYYKLLKMAETIHDGHELATRLLDLNELKYNSYPSSYFITELYDAGALDRTLSPNDQDGSPSSESESRPAQQSGGTSADDVSSSNSFSATADEEEEVIVIGGSSATQDAAAIAADDEDDTEDLEVSGTPHPLDYEYTVSEVGKRLIEDFSPTKRIEDLFEVEADLAPGMRAVMSYCDETARTKSDIEAMLKEAGYHIGLDLDSSFYMDRLEERGGLVWEDGWKTTAEGRECLVG